MYTKKLLLAIAFIGTVFSSQAQEQLDPFEYGVRIGLNSGSLYNADENAIYGVKSGLTIGGLAKFRFSRWFALQPELLFSQQNALDQEVFPAREIRNSYFIVPLLIKLYPARRFNLQIGPQLGILLTSTIGGVKNTDLFTPADIALAFGLEYEFNKGLLLGMRVSSSMTNLNDVSTASPLSDSPVQIGSAYFLFSAGWRF